MLLDDALVLLECPICLQRLGYERGRGAANSNRVSESDTDSYAPSARLHSSTSSNTHPTGGADTDDDDDSYGEGGIAVLMCGHMLHYLCVMQLYEYTKQATCPVCRAPVADASSIVRFAPRNKFAAHTAAVHSHASSASASMPLSSASSYASAVVARLGVTVPPAHANGEGDDVVDGHSSHLLEHMCTADGREGGADDARTHTRKRLREGRVDGADRPGREDDARTVCDDEGAHREESDRVGLGERDTTMTGGVEGGDDVTIVGTRHVPQFQVYRDRLLRVTSLYHARADTLVARKEQLQSSLRQLTEDCSLLDMTVSAARQRYEMMCSDGEVAHVDELRRLCAETKRACDSATTELASTMRINAQIKRQMEKYNRRLRR